MDPGSDWTTSCGCVSLSNERMSLQFLHTMERHEEMNKQELQVDLVRENGGGTKGQKEIDDGRF